MKLLKALESFTEFSGKEISVSFAQNKPERAFRTVHQQWMEDIDHHDEKDYKLGSENPERDPDVIRRYLRKWYRGGAKLQEIRDDPSAFLRQRFGVAENDWSLQGQRAKSVIAVRVALVA